jgi:hypothetical protein
MKKILGNNAAFSAYMKDNNLSYDALFDKVTESLTNNNELTSLINQIDNFRDEIQELEDKELENQSSLLSYIQNIKLTHPDFNIDDIDMNKNIYNFFDKYPTKECLRFADGSIINMTPDEPAVDFNFKKLPMKDGIPQGEEATRIVTRNLDTGVIIASPPGTLRSYFITRYGSPKDYGYHFDKYEELKTIVGIDFSSNCFFEKFGCNGKIQPMICLDLDTELNCCEKHHDISSYLLNSDIAILSDISQFYADKILNYLTSINQIKKVNLLKKIKILLNLAVTGRLKNRQLDSDFELYGINYYCQYAVQEKKNKCGWALIYYSIKSDKKKIAHIYLDELTDDIKALHAISLFTSEILLSKYDNDLLPIDDFISNQNKETYNKLMKARNQSYKINMSNIINNKLIV